MEPISKSRNNSIDIFRYICALLVVAIHTSPMSDVSQVGGLICTQVIPRIAVPFFFAVSGCYYIRKLINGERPFKKYFGKLIIVYSVISVPYFIYIFFANGYSDNFVPFIHNCIYTFVISGSFYHLWFFPALLFSVLAATIAYKCLKKRFNYVIAISILLYVIGCIGCAYNKIGVKIPLLNRLFLSQHFELIRRVLLMGFPFFISGYVVLLLEDKLKSISDGKLKALWALSFLVWIAEIAFVMRHELQENVVLTFGLYFFSAATFLLLTRDPWHSFEKLSRKCRVTAGFTYYFHPLIIIILNLVSDSLFKIQLAATPLFIITCTVSTLLGLLICKCRNRLVTYFFG